MLVQDRFDAAKQAMAFAIRTCSEEERVGSSGPAPVAEGERPKAVNLYGFVMAVLEQTLELTGLRVKRHDGSAAKVADQKIPGVLAEGARRERDTPWRIDRTKLAPCIGACDETMESAVYRGYGRMAKTRNLSLMKSSGRMVAIQNMTGVVRMISNLPNRRLMPSV